MTTTSADAVLAGCLAGGIGALVGFPLDTMKVRTQLARVGPAKSLLRGWSGPVLTAGLINSLNFGVYDRAWRALSGEASDLDCPMPVVFVAGALGGLAISPLTASVSRVKVLQQSCAFPGYGVVGVIRETAQRGGLRSLARGYGVNAAMEVNRGFYMCFFVLAKKALRARDEALLPLWKRSLAGAVAGMAAWVLIYPLDQVRTSLQARAPGSGCESAAAVAARLYREGGVRRLYSGMGFTVARAGPVAGILLPIYDYTLAALRDLR